MTAARAPAEALATRAPGAEWELRTFLELGALPTAVPCARLHTKHVTWEWQLGHLTEAAELLVSEITTNAIRASAGLTTSRFAGKWAAGTPPIRLWLYSDRQRLLIQVWDGNDQMPARQDADPARRADGDSSSWRAWPPTGGHPAWRTPAARSSGRCVPRRCRDASGPSRARSAGADAPPGCGGPVRWAWPRGRTVAGCRVRVPGR